MMNTKYFKSHWKAFFIQPVLLLALLFVAGACSDDDKEGSFLDFGITYTNAEGKLVSELIDDGYVYTTSSDAVARQDFYIYSDEAAWEVLPANAEDLEWITIWPSTGARDGNVGMTIKRSYLLEKRSCVVNVKAGGKIYQSFTIEQGASGEVITISPASKKSVPVEGAKYKVTVTANIAWTVAVETGIGWVTLGEKEGDTQVIIVAENPDVNPTGKAAERRKAKVFFTGTDNPAIKQQFEIEQLYK